MKTFHFLLLASFSFLIFSCGDDDEPEPFRAIATVDTAYSIGSTVTLDASQSQGIDGARAEWIYTFGAMEEGDLNSDTAFNRFSTVTSFVPKRIGTYQFTLRLTKNGQFSEVFVSFNVSGILEITDLSQLENFTFENLDNSPDPSVGDYLINTVLVIPAGNNQYIVEEGTTIKFGENGGLKIEGSLGDAFTSSGQTTSFNALGNSWKGIHVMGTFSIKNVIIDGGGNSSFTSDPNDAANLYVDEGGNLETELITFSGSAGYGIVSNKERNNGVFSSGSPNISFEDNVNTARIGSSNLSQFNFFINDKPNARFEVFYQSVNQRLFINREIIVLDSLVFSVDAQMEDASVKFNAGAYLKSFGYITINNSILTAEDPNPAAKWRGILVNGRADIENSEISNAGSGIIPGTSQPAALTFMGSGISAIFDGNTIKDNNGYGIYSEVGQINSISGCAFSNNTTAHVKMSAGTADAFRSTPNVINTFDGNITAVELFNPSPGNAPPGLTVQENWQNLGTGNFYLCDSDLDLGQWTVDPGTEIRMTVDKYIRVQSNFIAEGTASEPIVITSNLGNRGDWQGIQISNDASLDHVKITNAGRNTGIQTFSSPHGGGLVVNSNSNRNVSVTNCEITNAGEYGVVIQLNAGDFAIDSTASANTLEGALGGYFDAN